MIVSMDNYKGGKHRTKKAALYTPVSVGVTAPRPAGPVPHRAPPGRPGALCPPAAASLVPGAEP